jgi:Predicted dehydrogenases and related proteins
MEIAIIGCGSIARVHAAVIKQLANNKLSVFVDKDLEKAQAFAKEYGEVGARIYRSLSEMIQQDTIGAVHICTPHYLHVQMAVECLRNDIHVFMEKPPAISRESFKKLEAAASGKAKLGLCYQNRYNKGFQAAKDFVKAKKMGAIIGARAFVTWNRAKEYYSKSEWRGQLETEGGGALINQAIHTLDLVTELMGAPVCTEASIRNHHLKQEITVEDTVEAYIQYQTGNLCFYATTAYCTDAPIFIEITCEQGIIQIIEDEVTFRFISGEVMRPELERPDIALGKSYWGKGHLSCIGDFYKSIEDNCKFPIEIQDIKTSFQLLMDIYDSAKENKVVVFESARKEEDI